MYGAEERHSKHTLELDMLEIKRGKALKSYSIDKGNDGDQDEARQLRRFKRERERTRCKELALVSYGHLPRLCRPCICKEWQMRSGSLMHISDLHWNLSKNGEVAQETGNNQNLGLSVISAMTSEVSPPGFPTGLESGS